MKLLTKEIRSIPKKHVEYMEFIEGVRSFTKRIVGRGVKNKIDLQVKEHIIPFLYKRNFTK